MIKEKKCKGQNKAHGFESCGKITNVAYLKYGLCASCYPKYLLNDERGKVIMHKAMNAGKSIVKKESVKKEKVIRDKMKENVKTLSQHEADAKKSFQRWIRLRDAELNCISCDTVKAKEWHASHYFDCNRFSGLIFDPRNVAKSCDYCNVYLSGNLIEYRQGLIKRHGVEFVEQLESEADSKRVYKYTKQELIDIKKKYDTKIKNQDFS